MTIIELIVYALPALMPATIVVLVYCNMLLARRVRILEQHGPIASALRIEAMAEAQRLQLEYNKEVERKFDCVDDAFATMHNRIEGVPRGGPYR